MVQQSVHDVPQEALDVAPIADRDAREVLLSEKLVVDVQGGRRVSHVCEHGCVVADQRPRRLLSCTMEQRPRLLLRPKPGRRLSLTSSRGLSFGGAQHQQLRESLGEDRYSDRPRYGISLGRFQPRLQLVPGRCVACHLRHHRLHRCGCREAHVHTGAQRIGDCVRVVGREDSELAPEALGGADAPVEVLGCPDPRRHQSRPPALEQLLAIRGAARHTPYEPAAQLAQKVIGVRRIGRREAVRELKRHWRCWIDAHRVRGGVGHVAHDAGVVLHQPTCRLLPSIVRVPRGRAVCLINLHHAQLRPGDPAADGLLVFISRDRRDRSVNDRDGFQGRSKVDDGSSAV
mmetsp:Transcript_31406/g.77300  ORF Transcript_31406/g.77300 Transcript_31406/m.77300 type:complete len:345 (-) Transcript_31406:346-1380(-)